MRPDDQKNLPFEEPPLSEIPGISRMHVAGMEATNDDMVWVGAGMHQLLLRTIGRKSGREHKVALPYWIDDAGHRVVVGSFAGYDKHPAWYLNLADRTANPQVQIRVQNREPFWADAQILEGADYDKVWADLTADRPYYVDYQSRTSRKLPLVRFIERS
jgi:deazaflavin-dependent oxidoreductase (nitroreductase family)